MLKIIFPVLTSLLLPGLFTSCSLSFDSYNSRYSDYEITGIVVDDETSEAVRGVAVSLFEATVDDDEEMKIGYKLDSLVVDEDGAFSFYGRSYHGVPDCKYLKVTDLDADESGYYESEVFEIELSYEENPSSHNSTVDHEHYIVSDLVLELKHL